MFRILVKAKNVRIMKTLSEFKFSYLRYRLYDGVKMWEKQFLDEENYRNLDNNCIIRALSRKGKINNFVHIKIKYNCMKNIYICHKISFYLIEQKILFSEQVFSHATTQQNER